MPANGHALGYTHLVFEEDLSLGLRLVNILILDLPNLQDPRSVAFEDGRKAVNYSQDYFCMKMTESEQGKKLFPMHCC